MLTYPRLCVVRVVSVVSVVRVVRVGYGYIVRF